MKTVNMSPQMVQAIAAMQQNAQELVQMLDQTSKYVFEIVDVDNEAEAVQGFKELKVLSLVRSYIADFIEKEEWNMHTTLEYKIESTLRGALIVALEIQSETDLEPAYITTSDGVELEYNAINAAELQYNMITEQDYINQNKKQQ